MALERMQLAQRTYIDLSFRSQRMDTALQEVSRLKIADIKGVRSRSYQPLRISTSEL